MKARLLVALFGAAISLLAVGWPAQGHEDHDARPLARGIAVGPYTISLWHVYPDAGETIEPVLIVVFDDLSTAPAAATVGVTVNGRAIEVRRSPTTANGWETTAGVAASDVVAVTILEGGASWASAPVTVPAATTSVLPMRELVYASALLTGIVALWGASRVTRTWRRPAPGRS